MTVLDDIYIKYSIDPAFDTLRYAGSDLVRGFGYTNNPPVMFIGEAPGVLEDLKGQPFVGRSGVKFERNLNETGLKREQVFTTNVLKYHPPANRNPTQEELEASFPYLIEEIYAVNPFIVAPLGRFSMQILLPDQASITKANGKQYLSPFLGVRPIVPIIHPGASIRPGGSSKQIMITAGFAKLRDLLSGTVPST